MDGNCRDFIIGVSGDMTTRTNLHSPQQPPGATSTKNNFSHSICMPVIEHGSGHICRLVSVWGLRTPPGLTYFSLTHCQMCLLLGLPGCLVHMWHIWATVFMGIASTPTPQSREKGTQGQSLLNRYNK